MAPQQIEFPYFIWKICRSNWCQTIFALAKKHITICNLYALFIYILFNPFIYKDFLYAKFFYYSLSSALSTTNVLSYFGLFFGAFSKAISISFKSLTYSELALSISATNNFNLYSLSKKGNIFL